MFHRTYLYRVTVTSGSKGFRKGHFPQTSDVGLFSVTFDTKKCSCKRILGAVNAYLCSQKCGTITLIVIRCIFRARSEPKCVCRWCCAPDPTGVTYIILTTTPSFISERKARDGKEKGRESGEGRNKRGSENSENSFKIPWSQSDENLSSCALVTVVVSLPAVQYMSRAVLDRSLRCGWSKTNVLIS